MIRDPYSDARSSKWDAAKRDWEHVLETYADSDKDVALGILLAAVVDELENTRSTIRGEAQDLGSGS